MAARCDLLVIGAGPAGSAAAIAASRQGLKVTLVDRHDFPRDKTCGDALIPDAIQALSDLDVKERILRRAHPVRSIRIYSPNGAYTSLSGECACLPRIVLDEELRAAAEAAGADFRPSLRAVAPIDEGGQVAGGRFEQAQSGAPVELRAATTILATGAAADVLSRFGMCERTAPSATAARLYVRVDAATAREHNHFTVAYASGVCPGYGWIFPGPDCTFNVGVGYVYGASAPGERNVRVMLDRFLHSFPPARGLMQGAAGTGPLKGAPLRTAMSGARLSRPGLLVVGEAAGLTYSFSGEGIGKALQSGILAAEVVAANGGSGAAVGLVAVEYAARLTRAYAARFRAYDRLQRLVSSEWLADALIARANTGHYVRDQLQALLDESGRADGLLSARGLLRAVFT